MGTPGTKYLIRERRAPMQRLPRSMQRRGLGAVPDSELRWIDMDKTVASADDAVADLRDGATLMAGGFGLCGIPENLIQAILRRGTRELTVISNNCGIDGKGLGLLLGKGQVKKIIASYVGENKTFERLYLDGKLDVELTPQGTLAERIRAGGAGIPAFYTATGFGTKVAEGKETREIEGRMYVLETALRADVAIVKAWKGDRFGNLVYRKTTRNFNPMMAAAGRLTIAEVETLVEPGALDPDGVHTPGIYVQRIVEGARFEKPIEQRTVSKRPPIERSA
jgi:3-oxoacid CoA-transferase subunit A